VPLSGFELVEPFDANLWQVLAPAGTALLLREA